MYVNMKELTPLMKELTPLTLPALCESVGERQVCEACHKMSRS
jgi:hypothetical protein